MIAASSLTAFAGASFALAVTPGPDMMLCATRASMQGRAAGFATLAGIMTGLQIHAAAAGLGLSQILVATPSALAAIRWSGAAYLLYLAIKIMRAPSQIVDAPSLPPVSLAEAYRVGLLTNLLNPKVILFVLALYPQFISAQDGVFGQMMLLGLVNNLVAAPVNGAVIVFAARLGGSLSGVSTRWRWSGRALVATLFFGLAARLALGSRA